MRNNMSNQHEDPQDKLQFCNHNLNIEFTDLCYYPPTWRGSLQKKSILKSISGKIRAGRLTALVGPSGAGKSTLLNILTGFKVTGVTGSVTVNGKERNIHDFRKKSCYIAQEFDMLPFLTTKETMVIAAELKLGTNIKHRKILEIVHDILELLGLEKTVDTPVDKLSGGQKKRLSVGLELLTNPPIMFFDEPTSGLDSSSAVQVISHLKYLARGGRTVTCSIHQPSSRILEMFDDIYVLTEGQCIYYGPITEMTSVFEELGFSCPNYYNRAEFAIEVASGERGGNIDQLIDKFRRQENAAPEYHQCNEESQMLNPVKSKFETAIQVTTEKETTRVSRSRYPTPVWRQFWVLLKRAIFCTYRSNFTFSLHVLSHIIVGLLLGAVYYNIGNDAEKTTSNVGCIFFFVLFLFFSNAMPSVLLIPQEMSVVLREHLNNWYSVTAYYFSKQVAVFPIMVLCPTVFLCAGYFLTDQPCDGTRLLQFWIICFLMTLIGQGMGMSIGVVMKNIELGMIALPISTIPLMLFSGFLLKLQDVPQWLQWVTNISHFRYAFEGSMQAIYGYNRPSMNCNLIYCYFKSPRKFLEELDMLESVYLYDVIGLFVWIILLQMIVYLTLKFRIYMSR